MHNAFGKLVTLGLLGSGFVATGDLGWLARRGMRLLEASTVPSEAAPLDPTESPAANAPGAAPDRVPPAAPGDSASAPTPEAAAPWQATRPPAGGPTAIELAALEPGTRLFIWVAVGPAHGQPHRCLAFDIVDPASGAALLHRGHEPPRRVVLLPPADAGLFASRGMAGRIMLRGTVRVQSAGLAHGQAGQGLPETIGPIVALAVAH